jgi:hypothetical protein
MEAIIEEMNEVARRPATKEALAVAEPTLPPEHATIRARSMAYCLCVHQWLRGREDELQRTPADPVAVISWFASLNASKIGRALEGLAEDDGDRDFPPDHEGSAKVAIIGIERSRTAWRELVARGVVTESQAQPFLTELSWLGLQLERVFPFARAFVRPAFDELEEVAMLIDD